MSVTEVVAGRALDIEIARRIFKVKRIYSGHFDGALWKEGDEWPQIIPSGKPWRTHSIDAVGLPRYSENMLAAWTVATHFRATMTFVLRDTLEATYVCEIGNYVAEADTAPLAICRVALKCVEGRLPDG